MINDKPTLNDTEHDWVRMQTYMTVAALTYRKGARDMNGHEEDQQVEHILTGDRSAEHRRADDEAAEDEKDGVRHERQVHLEVENWRGA